MEYLNDTKFLEDVDNLKIRVQYAKIVLLDFTTEKPIKEIQGRITQGIINVNGSSSVRRTLSLTMICDPQLSQLENIDNEISINKKIKVEIGYKNPLKQYQKYGDMIWFPCGVFVISSVTLNRSTSGYTFSISGKDKMVLLNGSVGGTFFGATTLNTKQYLPPSNDESTQVADVTMYDIVYETVNHFGEVPANKIIISDLDRQAAALVRYKGSSPIYLTEDHTIDIDDNQKSTTTKYTTDDLIGYAYTEWTYPIEKDLVANAGDTVESVLNKIVQILGNYEFYFDIDGNFVFKQQDNYSQTSSPLNELDPTDYVKTYSNTKYQYCLTNTDAVQSITKNPKYENIKNDFVAWGTKQVGEDNDATVGIHYRLAIDEKPDIQLANKYMWEYKKLIDTDPYLYETHYLFADKEYSTKEFNKIHGDGWVLVGKPCTEWREELYRRMVVEKSSDGGQDWYSSYDAEMDSFWRDLFDTMKWSKETNYFNPDVIDHPENLRFWLDFIDPKSILGQYAISAIGRRTVVQTQNSVNKLFTTDVPSILFVNEDQYKEDKKAIDDYAVMNGLTIYEVNEEFEKMFVISQDNTTAFDVIRNMLYQYLTFQTQITLNCIPKYYLEPNNILYLVDKNSGIAGNYIINSYSLPLTYNDTMSIQLTEAYTRL